MKGPYRYRAKSFRIQNAGNVALPQICMQRMAPHQPGLYLASACWRSTPESQTTNRNKFTRWIVVHSTAAKSLATSHTSIREYEPCPHETKPEPQTLSCCTKPQTLARSSSLRGRASLLLAHSVLSMQRVQLRGHCRCRERACSVVCRPVCLRISTVRALVLQMSVIAFLLSRKK